MNVHRRVRIIARGWVVRDRTSYDPEEPLGHRSRPRPLDYYQYHLSAAIHSNAQHSSSARRPLRLKIEFCYTKQSRAERLALLGRALILVPCICGTAVSVCHVGGPGVKPQCSH
eukprot:4742813-Amphidinium_carterae.1